MLIPIQYLTMRFIILFVFLISSLYIQAQADYSRARVDLRGQSLAKLSSLGVETDHGHLEKGRFLINDFSKEEIQTIQNAGFDVKILIADVKQHYKDQNIGGHQGHHHNEATVRNIIPCDGSGGGTDEEYSTPVNYTYGSMGGYHTYAELMIILDDMQAKYPHLISVKDTVPGVVTHEGRPIYWLRVSDNPNMDEDDEPEVLYTALHHAREANSLSQMIFYLWYLLENYDTDEKIKYIVDHTEMYFMPCVNPDGYIWNETTDPEGGGLWRKNRAADLNGEVFGVDLNRNYGYEWGLDDSGSSPVPQSDTYRGESAFSEPETQAVRDFCEDHQFQIALNYHTFGNLMIHPWGFNDMPTDEDAIFKGMAGIMTAENNFLIGTGTETVGYVVNGDSDDWMYGETTTKPKIYALTPEVGPNEFGFWPPQSAIDGLNKSCLLQNITTAQLLFSFVEYTESSTQVITQKSGVLPITITNYGLQSGEVTLSITSDDSTVEVEENDLSYTLAPQESQVININYQVLSDETVDITFLVSLTQNGITTNDKITKQYVAGDFEIIWADDTDDFTNWETEGSWSIIDTDFATAPNSITDSPNENYDDDQVQIITTAKTIDLTLAEYAVLRYQAKWEIEQGWDYVQIQIAGNDGEYKAQCGSHTVLGNGNQDEGQPLYDDTQDEWIAEEVSLSQYIGQEISIRFVLVSDAYVNGDGFYFDDIYIEGVQSEDVSTVDDIIGLHSVSINPNPVTESMRLKFSLDKPSSHMSYYIVNAIGQVVDQKLLGYRASGHHEISIDTDDYEIGLYNLILKNDHENVNVQKFVRR